MAPRDFVQEIWRTARNPESPEGQPCPSCRRPAREVPGVFPAMLDVCPRCQLVWFDPAELDTVPRTPDPDEATRLRSPEAARALAEFEVEHQSRLRRAREGHGAFQGPADLWKWLPGLLGLPVEHDARALAGRPWVTWGLGAVLVLVGVLTFAHIDRIAQTWGLVPASPFAHGGLNFLTSFFLHAGWLHLLGNLYFLVTFGDDVEELLGPLRMVVLLFLSAFVGDVLHVLLTPETGVVLGRAARSVPAIGSSGGISGVLAFYALALPRARIGLLFYWVFWLRVPAWGYLAFWVFLQVLGTALGGGGVAYLAHLGGALGGVLLWVLWRGALLGSRKSSPAPRGPPAHPRLRR